MELTPQIAQTMIDARLHEYPQMRAVVQDAHFGETLTQILDFERVDQGFFSTIENEVLIVLSLYAPLTELAQNIQEATELPRTTCENIAGLIETLILSPVSAELTEYSIVWRDEEAKSSRPDDIEEITRPLASITTPPQQPPSMPTSGESSRPLTREEVLRALQPRKTGE